MISSQLRRLWKSISRGSGGSAVIVALLQAPRKHRGVETPTPGLTSTRPSAGKPGTSDNSSPVPRAISGLAARHIGRSAPSAAADPRQFAHADVQLPESAKPAQRRRGVARPAADAGRDRQVLLERDRDRRRVAWADNAARRASRAFRIRLLSSSGTAGAYRPDTTNSSRSAGIDRYRSPKRVKTARLSIR